MACVPGEGPGGDPAAIARQAPYGPEPGQYPEVRPDLPARSRGVIALVEENCTVCMLCARECPDWCIYIDSHKETVPAPGGGRPRAHNVLDRFAIDFSLCMYCGICVEVCPFDALFWSPEFEYAEYDVRDLLHEKDRLGEWVATVPPPPGHEVGAEPPKGPLKGPSAGARGQAARPPVTGPAKGPDEGASVAEEAAGRPTGQGTTQPAGPEAGRAPEGGAAERPGAPGKEPARGTEPANGPRNGTAGGPGNGASQGSGNGAAGGPGNRPRREPPRAMRDVRSIRPPGSLPKKSRQPGEKGGPEGES
ncbi:4Fe-4S binding protein [Microbispora triticiradicis]|nr:MULTISPECIES: 4Fe-4S binding protein [Microbispora]